MVDANGVELPTINGQYIEAEAFLKLVGGNADETYGVAIDELDSLQLGRPDASPAEEGTNRAFSHYFGLNNFFESNLPTTTGDTLRGSATSLRVQQRLLDDPSLISTGKLVRQDSSAATNNNDVYTYVRFSGDNCTAQQLANFNTLAIAFDSAGGLPATQQSLLSYSSDLLAFISQRSSEATDNAVNTQTLLDGFTSKADASSGVNLDEELANTITFQNAYSATARIITVVNQLYEDLLAVF